MTTIAIPVLAVTPLLVLRGGLTDAAREALDVSPAEIVKRWLAALSHSCARTYKLALRKFASWALTDATEPQAALQVLVDAGCGPAHEMVTKWRDELLESGLAPGTVAVHVSGLSSLLKACRRAGLVTWRLEQVSPKAERRQDRSGPRRGDVERLMACVDDRAAAGQRRAVRDAAIIRLLYCAALRRAEVCNLRLEDLQLEHPDGAAVFPRRKGKRERERVLIAERTAVAIRAWLALRGDATGAVFLRTDIKGAEPAMMSGESVRRLLRSRARQAGVQAIVRPHGLRHSAATECARRGSLAQLMALGGWKSFSAAQAYLDRHAAERRGALELVDL